jgi:hypothetical protein
MPSTLERSATFAGLFFLTGDVAPSGEKSFIEAADSIPRIFSPAQSDQHAWEMNVPFGARIGRATVNFRLC